MLSIDRLRANFRAPPHWSSRLRFAPQSYQLCADRVTTVAVDTSVFLLTYSYLISHAAALASARRVGAMVGCTSRDTLVRYRYIVAWVVGVSVRYAMNSFITFAADPAAGCAGLDYGTSWPRDSRLIATPPRWSAAQSCRAAGQGLRHPDGLRDQFFHVALRGVPPAG